MDESQDLPNLVLRTHLAAHRVDIDEILDVSFPARHGVHTVKSLTNRRITVTVCADGMGGLTDMDAEVVAHVMENALQGMRLPPDEVQMIQNAD